MRGFTVSLSEPHADSCDAWWFVVADDQILVRDVGNGPTVPTSGLTGPVEPAAGTALQFGTYDGRRCMAARPANPDAVPAPFQFVKLRPLFGALPDHLWSLAGTASHILHWHEHSRFCGRCGAPAAFDTQVPAKKCTGCGALIFPRINPAVIVAITRSDRLLLARNGRFPGAMHSLVAGFVEPGERLEETVAREIREEVGLEVDDIRYFGSQPWPFPDSLMVGFTAQWRSGEIRVDGHEIVEANWYGRDALPEIPRPGSISRRLIDRFAGTEPDR